jgi:alkaline phosphatase
MGDRFVLGSAGGWNNTDLPKFIAAALGVDMDGFTELLNANWTEWVPRDDEGERKPALKIASHRQRD